jgi:GNAT superfamily N-acetyltransferase
MDIAVTPFDVADEAAVEQAYLIVAASGAADVPDLPALCRQRFVGSLRHPRPGVRLEHALAYLDGQPVGYLSVELPQLDNLDNADVQVHVHPEHRRRGAGRALLGFGIELVTAAGRKRIIAEAVATLPGGVPRSEAGTAFATAMGAKAALTDVRSRLDLATLDQTGIDRLLAAAQARSEGYSLVRWQDRAPEEYVDDVAYLDGRLLTDAPLGDLALEPEKVDAARIRATEDALAARGRRTYHCGARHDATGRLVAWTMLDFGATSRWHAFQQITLVDPEHRGHRLGALVKIENLRYARSNEPESRTIDTWNAETNASMISINQAMGFRPVERWYGWQLEL